MPEELKDKYGPEEERMLEEELEDLRLEIEHFQKEKERVREMVGRMGGVPTFNTRFYNIVFVTALMVCLVVSVIWFRYEFVHQVMIEAAVALISVKLLLLMHNQSKVNHLQLWLLTSLEWRLNELMKQVKKQN
jgi:hypothetical protein